MVSLKISLIGKRVFSLDEVSHTLNKVGITQVLALTLYCDITL